MSMKVYRIETGIIHYAAAPGLIQALEAYANLARSECIDTHNDEEHMTVERTPEKEARELLFWDDGVGERRPCWDMAQECEEPTVFACSEWP